MADQQTTDRLQTRETMLLGLMRQMIPRCYQCGAAVHKSNYACSGCGTINILPEDINDAR